MKKSLFITATLACSLGVNFSVFALPTPVPQVTPSQNSLKGEEAQGEQSAAMIESAQAAKIYVGGLDKQEYRESWTQGDELFQHTISQGEWVEALNLSRKPLGQVRSRVLKDQRPAWDPRGLPKGAYMVVEYETSFENAPSSGELLTLRKGSDGTWRVLTYQVN